MKTLQKREKRLWIIAWFAIIVLAFVLMQADDVTSAQKPASWGYTNTFTWEVHLDTTVAVKHDTIVEVGSGLAPPFYFTGLGPYEKINGYIYVEAISADTGDAAADVIDTTKDSMIYVMYTACESDHAPKRVIELDSLIKGGGGEDTVWFTIPNDSAICREVFFYFISAIKDSDYSVVRAEAGLTYRATISMMAK